MNPQQSFGQIQAAANTISGSLAAFRDAQENARAPASKVDAILQQLKAQDTPYQDLVQNAESLYVRKFVLHARIDGMMNAFADATSRVSSLSGNVDLLNTKLTSAMDLVDSPGLQAAADIALSVRARLDFYHYLVVKAYEFYTGESYPGDRRAANAAESLSETLRAHGGDATKAAEAYATAYGSEVRAVGQSLIAQLATRGRPGKHSFTIRLTGKELDHVNRMLTPNGGGTPDLAISLENLALLPVTDFEARLIGVRADYSLVGRPGRISEST